MQMKKMFKLFIYAFVILVPLISFEKTVCYVPVSSNVVLSIGAIIFGTLYIIKNYKSVNNELHFYNDKNMKPFFILIVIYTAFGFLSMIYAKDKFCAFSETTRFLQYVFLFYLIVVLADKKFIKNCLYLLYISMMIVSVFGLIQFGCDLSRFYDIGVPFHRGRIYATFVNPNYWGAAVNIVIFYPFLKILQRANKRRWMDILVFCLFFINLLLTFTRGSWMGFIVGIIVLAVMYYKKILYILPVGITSIFVIPSFRGRFMSTFDMDFLTNWERFVLWKTGYLMFKEHLFTGVGNGNFLYMYRIYIKKYPELYMQKDQRTVHNSYLKSLAELGIFGGILFTAIYFYMVYLSYICYKKIKDKNYKIVALSFMAFWGAYMFQNFFNTLTFIPQINSLVWVIFALIYKYSCLEEKDAEI